jgi:hypothetical protein
MNFEFKSCIAGDNPSCIAADNLHHDTTTYHYGRNKANILAPVAGPTQANACRRCVPVSAWCSSALRNKASVLPIINIIIIIIIELTESTHQSQQVMRFSTAISILLTHAIPATSSTKKAGDGSLLLLKKNRKMTRRGLSQATSERIMKYAEDVSPPVLDDIDAFQEDPSIQDMAFGQAPGQDSSSGLLLKNIVKQSPSLSGTEKKMECDPSSQELDIGILSCGKGQYCDERTESSIGGLCVVNEDEASSFTRMLQDDLTPYCSGDLYISHNCNCQAVDNTTGTGEVICTPYENCCSVADGESLICRTLTYNITFVDRAFGSFETCYDFTQPYARSACVTTYYSTDLNPNNTCAWIIDDERCSSCNFQTSGIGRKSCKEFNCTNIPVAFAAASNECSGPEPIFHPLPILDELQLLVDGCDNVTTPAPISTLAPAFSILIPAPTSIPTPAPIPTPALFLAGCSLNSDCLSKNCKNFVCRSSAKAIKGSLAGRGRGGAAGLVKGINRRRLRGRRTRPRGA